MAITFVAAGAFSAGTASVSPALPTGWAAGDLHVLLVQTSNQAVPSTPTGWNTVVNSPQGTGTAAAAGATRITAFYRFAQTGDTAPATGDSGDHQQACVVGFRGVDTTTPIEITAGTVAASSTAVSFPGVTTTTANDMIVHVVANATDSATAQGSATVTNAALTGLARQANGNTTSGTGGGITVYTGTKATAGATGSTATTITTASAQALLTLALKPAFDPGSGSQQTPALVQSNEGASLSAPVSVSFNTAPTSGNLLILAVNSDSTLSGTPTGWTQASFQNQFSASYVFWRISDGTNSFSYSLTASSNSCWELFEFSGIYASPLDTANSQGATSIGTNTASTASITPATGVELLFAAVGFSNSAADFDAATDATWTNSFVSLGGTGTTGGGTDDAIVCAYRIVTGNGTTSYSTTATLNEGTAAESYGGHIISFKAAVSTGTTYTGTTTETATATESEASTLTAAASLTDAATATESGSSVLSAVAAATETATATTSQTATLSGSSAVTETATATDAVTGGLSIPGAASETAVASDASASTLAAGASASEQATAAEASTATLATAAGTSETATATDSVTGGLTVGATATETATATDAATATLIAAASITETAAAGDSSTGLPAGQQTVTETATATDSATATLVAGAATVETAVSTDDTSAILSLLGIGAETATATDAASAGLSFTAAATEAATVGDAVSSSFAILAALLETATALDAVSETLIPVGAGPPSPDPVHITGTAGRPSVPGQAHGAHLVGANASASIAGRAKPAVLTGRSLRPKIT